ncbi:MAG TPA: type VI secretion system baseplate subunit TssG [Thermohalobaculum sp.]|nr:type VI secretion system baseplate subunit TssG [Thermohalobaculum sp.]
MADDARRPAPRLTPPREAIAPPLPPADAEFFQMLRLFEAGGQRFGRGRSPADEPARLGQQVREVFATRDVAELQPATNRRPPRARLNNFGLLGPEGPMPLHLTRWTLDRLSQRWFATDEEGVASDTTFADFCDLLQHRAATLHYRAWADQRLEVQNDHGEDGRLDAMLAALAGTGMPGQRHRDTVPDGVKLTHAPALAQQVSGPDRLVRFVAAVVGARVELVEFVGEWIDLPRRLQSRLGAAGATLGAGAVAGARIFQRAGRIELRIGPLGRAAYDALLPGRPALRRLVDAIRFAIGEALVVDLRLVLARAEVPRARCDSAALGRDAWLPGRREEDAGDMVVRAAVGRTHEAA